MKSSKRELTAAAYYGDIQRACEEEEIISTVITCGGSVVYSDITHNEKWIYTHEISNNNISQSLFSGFETWQTVNIDHPLNASNAHKNCTPTATRSQVQVHNSLFYYRRSYLIRSICDHQLLCTHQIRPCCVSKQTLLYIFISTCPWAKIYSQQVYINIQNISKHPG